MDAKRDNLRERTNTDVDDLDMLSIGVHHILTLPSLSETKGG